MDTKLELYSDYDVVQDFFGSTVDDLPTSSGWLSSRSIVTRDSFSFPSLTWQSNGSTRSSATHLGQTPKSDDTTSPSNISTATIVAHLVSVLLAMRDPRSTATLASILTLLPEPEESFISAIRIALATDAPLVARRLAELANERYPHHPEIAKANRILRPPRVVPASGRKVDVQANRAWLLEHRDEYKGRWVALLDGQLLADSASVDSLIENVGQVKGTGILLTWVS